MKFETILQDEIANELSELRKMELGSDEYRGTVDGVAKLMDKAIELERIDAELQEKIEARQEENDFKLKQQSDDNKDRIVRNVIAVAGIIIPTAVTIWGTIKSIEFEKEGTITTIMGRGFISKLIPKK